MKKLCPRKIKLAAFVLFTFFAKNFNTVHAGKYHLSDLGFSSHDTGIRFFDEVRSMKKQRYQSAMIYSKKPLEGFESKERNGWHFTFLKGQESEYQDLDEVFDLGETLNASYNPSSITTKPHFCTSTTLQHLAKELELSDIVCITFGAGISQGYIPTLIEFFEDIGLEKVISDDTATPQSLQHFIQRLWNPSTQEEMLGKIKTSWEKIINHQIRSTPAHKALASLATLLQSNGKQIFIYTDNIDGIHDKVGIQLSEENNPFHAVTMLIYPSKEKLKNKHVTVLAIGQSFDFQGILSSIYTQKETTQSTRFFSLNTSLQGLNIYDGIYVPDLKGQTPAMASKPLEAMECVQGDVQKTLPALYEILKTDLSKEMFKKRFLRYIKMPKRE